jgi:outer membrane lipoprotein SlyB
MSTLRTGAATVLMALFTATGAAAQSLSDANGGGTAPPAAVNPAPVVGAPTPRVCSDCGVVESIRYVEQQGQASGVGAVAGGVLGGVLGHQIGSGRGNTVATIAGAGAGAYAGHQVEKNHNRKSYWTVALRMDDGRTRSFTYAAKPAVHEGERAKLIDGGKRLALLAN